MRQSRARQADLIGPSGYALTMPAMSARADTARLGERLQYLTILWNAAECIVALVAGFVAGTSALVGFWFDSAIEGTTSVAARPLCSTDPDAHRLPSPERSRTSLRPS